jgi:MFS family permease
MVDGYGNVLTPLLPLLITNLHLSLAGAGALQMCFQLANSVAQLGFGHLADRSNPRVLLIAGPILAVAMLPLIGLAPTAAVLAAC